MKGRSGPVVLVLYAVGWLSLPLLASVISDEDLGVFLVTLLTLGPLAVLLYVGGGRDDGRRASAGFARRAPKLAMVAGVFVVLGVIAAAVGNPAWLLCFWLSVFFGAAAHAWGFRLHRQRVVSRR